MQRLELRNHPAQATDRRKGPDGNMIETPLFEADGTPTPLILDQHGIYYSPAEGVKFRLVGYCRKIPGRHISLIEHFPESVVGFIEAEIEKALGGPSTVLMVKPPTPAEEPEEEEPSPLILPPSYDEEEEAEVDA